jgi:hypothetical protein
MKVMMSAFGTKRTSQPCYSMSAFGGKADIAQTQLNVCLGGFKDWAESGGAVKK